jgi:alpha-N-acetylglucosamine transferase
MSGFRISDNRRWVDQFTKLQLWKFTEYDRIVYMDSDMFPLANTEELFSMDICQKSNTDVRFEYCFAASPNLLGKGQEGSVNVGIGFNAGFFMLKPDSFIFDKIWQIAMVPEQPWNLHRDMEQGLLNEFFKSSGETPMVPLHWSWNVKDMSDEWMAEAKVVHARWAFLIFR